MEFTTVSRILFGRGQAACVGEVVGAFGGSAFIIYNGGKPDGESPFDRITELLAASRICSVGYRQKGEPTVAGVDESLDVARATECDCVIGLGGGSAIDAAKAIAGLLSNGGSALDYMEVIGKGQKLGKPALPWIAIPTTAGTGAEVTRNAVIGDPSRRFKASIRSEHLLARLALIDPELGVGVPPDVTAYSGMDALCQCIESYTSTGASPMTDPLALQGVRLAARSLRNAYRNGTDLQAREEMAMAALLSGITLSNAGLGAVHGFAAPLGANFPAPHGAVCAALLPHVMAANVQALRNAPNLQPALQKYADIGRAMGDMPGEPSRDDAIEHGVRFVIELCRDLQIAPLSKYGIANNDIPEIIGLARKASSMKFNPVALSDESLAQILENAIDHP